MSRHSLPAPGFELGKGRFRLRDLVNEAILSITSQPGRSLLTTIGTVLGAAAFVATLGISSTLSNQVSTSFDVRRATEVLVSAAQAGVASDDQAGELIPDWQTEQRLGVLRGLNGVRSAGPRLLLTDHPIRRSPSDTAITAHAKIIGADPGAIGVIEPRITLGRTYGQYHEASAAPVVLLPARIAEQLRIDRVGVAVFVGDRSFTVLGIFDDVARRTEALTSIVIPFATANQVVSAATEAEPPTRDVVIKTDPGAAQLIGSQAALALLPTAPTSLQTSAPPDPKTLRREIEGNIAQLSLILSVVALVIGTVSIGNAATAGIAARIPEIGLRRAIGARPRHIFTQLLGETTLLGAIGGVIGALLGLLVVVSVALSNRWTPIIDLRVALVAAGGGALAGLLAGLAPAVLAVRIQPVAALQR